MTRVGQAPSLRAGLLLGLVLSSGCSPDSQEALPRGTALLGEARSFARLLAAAESLRGTPVAVAAGAARRRLESCEEFEAFCAPGEDCRLLERLECGSGRPELAEARRALEGSDWLLSRFYGPDERWVLRGRLEGDGSVSARLELSLPAELGAFSLLLPGEAARGPSTLSHRRALTHARVRPEDGLNVAALVPGEGWGAAIFRLQSELFVGRALEGVWELAIYRPEEGQRIPPTALGLDFKDRETAVRVMEGFIAEVMRAWPVRKSPFSQDGWPGVCLSNLRVLPDLAPCYVATDRALVVGWNALSLKAALGGEESLPDHAERPAGGALVAYLERFPEADAILARATGGELDEPPSYPFRRLELVGGRSGRQLVLDLRLEAP